MISWLLLGISMVLEIIATSSLKASDGFTKLWPSITSIAGYVLCFYLLSIALRKIDVSIAYAIWSAVGIVSVAIIGFFWFHEPMSWLKALFIGLIIVGSVGLQLISK